MVSAVVAAEEAEAEAEAAAEEVEAAAEAANTEEGGAVSSEGVRATGGGEAGAAVEAMAFPFQTEEGEDAAGETVGSDVEGRVTGGAEAEARHGAPLAFEDDLDGLTDCEPELPPKTRKQKKKAAKAAELRAQFS